MASPFGLALRGIKSSESRMRSLGYNVGRHLYVAFVLSGVFASIAGVLFVYFVVQQLEGYVLTPLIQQFEVELPGVILLFAVFGFGILFGMLGVVLAAPLTVVLYVLVKRLYVIEALHTATPIPGEKD